MTPKERAQKVFDECQARGQGVIGDTDPWIEKIAAAIHDAVLEERKACREAFENRQDS